jgi:hypothetical protein
MDYNFFVVQSGGKEGPKNKHKDYENQMVESYVRYFDHNYYGNRAPVHIGHHFSQMNGGAYWKAMQRFARYVRGKPNVICGTYKELMRFVEENKSRLEAYQAGNFDKPAAPPRLSMAAEIAPSQLAKFQARKNTRVPSGCCHA